MARTWRSKNLHPWLVEMYIDAATAENILAFPQKIKHGVIK